MKKHKKMNQTSLMKVLKKEFEGKQFTPKKVLNILGDYYSEFINSTQLYAVIKKLLKDKKIEEIKEGTYKLTANVPRNILKSINDKNCVELASKKIKEGVVNEVSEVRKINRNLKKKSIDIAGKIFDILDESLAGYLKKTRFKNHKLNVQNTLATIEGDMEKLEEKLASAIYNNAEEIVTQEFE